MVGQTVNHYTILKKLGAGGMGEVFLAHDRSLDRKVALKFLSEFLQQNEQARTRFLREAKSAGALDHPYICHIHEVGEFDGKSFISMEYVQGATLKDRLKEGPLPLKDALETAREIAEALEEAHKHGIVHRDLKPSNIMITPQGHAKVMDFGLAKRLPVTQEAKSDEKTLSAALTRTGVRAGTLAYMSPEQLRQQEVDTRSDLFSFGVILCEMLTAEHPFKREGPFETASAILREDPPPLSRYQDRIPPLLQHTIGKLLAKDRQHRYQLAHEVRIDLKRVQEESELRVRRPPGIRVWTVLVLLSVVLSILWLKIEFFSGTSRQEAETPGIAILPFVEIGSDPGLEYLGEGLTEELINAFTHLRDINVVNRTSVFHFKGRMNDLAEIARQLHVHYVLTGTVRSSGNAVRVSAQLVNAEDGYQLWAQSYERSMEDVFELQETMAGEIAETLEVELRRIFALPSKAQKPDPEAYDLYLRGRYRLNQRTREGLQKAIQYFSHAVEKDKTFALAYAGLADAFALSGSVEYGDLPRAQAILRAREAATQALQIDDDLAQAHTSLAFISFWYDWDWSRAEASFKRAIRSNPGYTTSHHWYADYLMIMGRRDEALQEIRRACKLDPLSLIVNTALGTHLYFNRQYKEAAQQLLKTLELDPGFPPARLSLGAVYLQQGRIEEAIAEFEAARRISSGPGVTSELGHAYGVAGRKELAARMLQELLKRQDREYVSPLYLAVIHVGLGQNQEAFRWLRRGYEDRAHFLDWLVVDPRFDPIRSDPRFRELMQAIGLPVSVLPKPRANERLNRVPRPEPAFFFSEARQALRQ